MNASSDGGLPFDDQGVVRAYTHRPPYPEALFSFLVDLPAQHRRALDLGCGPGNIAHRLAPAFDLVDAVDPAAAMLRVADNGRHPNITWIHGFAESVELTGPYDLVAAGASIHWMDHEKLFARLAPVVQPAAVMAVIEGDDVWDAQWLSGWEDFLKRWLTRLGRKYKPGRYRDWMTAYQSWIEISGRRTFETRFPQQLKSFIECQHSRATWSRARLGPERSAEFDAELHALLSPYASNGAISYTTRAEVTWGELGNR